MEEGVLTKAECEAVDWGKVKRELLIIKRFTKDVIRFFEKLTKEVMYMRMKRISSS